MEHYPLYISTFFFFPRHQGTDPFEFSQEEAIAEGPDDEEELEELRARLAKVRS